MSSQTVLQLPPDRSLRGSTSTRRRETDLAKPNYRHQKKQKELVRKTRQAEKIARRTQRDATSSANQAESWPAGAPQERTAGSKP